MRRSLASLLCLSVAIAAAAPASSCSSGGAGNTAGGGGDAGGGAGGGSGAVTVEPASVELTVPLGGSTTQDYKAFTSVGGQKKDVTDTCSFYVDAAFGSMVGAQLVAAPHGGKTTISADCGAGLKGDSQLGVQVKGTVVSGSASEQAANVFSNAQLTDDPARTPTLLYPLDHAVAPLNIPPIEVQYQAAQNDLFHVTLASTFLSVDIYTTDITATLSAADWTAVAGTAAGESLAISVEALAQAAPTQKYASGPVTLKLSHDTIDKTALYYWASSQGNVMSQVFGETSAPTAVKGDCTSCHSVSRSGSRIGYSRCVGGDCAKIFVGFMRYDKNTKQWVDKVDANNMAIPGSYTTFSPVGYPFPADDKSVAIVTTNTAHFELRNPDTGELLPSNISEVANHGPAGAPRAALMPDWSPDGKRIVFSSTPYPGQWIDLSEGAIALMDYTYNAGQHVFGEPSLLVTGPIQLPNGTYNNFFFPSFSPDGNFIVFNGARTTWRDGVNAAAPGQRLFLADTKGTFTVDLAEMNGQGDLDITWPHWAPGDTNDYLWVVFSSERDYGHKVTAANSNPACKQNGVQQCKQLWIGAIDKQKLATMGGAAIDPSAPPVWLPGQDIGADNISPYWTVPTSEIPQ